MPGLDAKPIIDIQISVPDIEDEDAYRAAIEAAGSSCAIARSAIATSARHRTGRASTRSMLYGRVPWERDHLLFRDFLRNHAEEAARYEAVKYDVAGHHRDNRIAYMDAKQPVHRPDADRSERIGQPSVAGRGRPDAIPRSTATAATAAGRARRPIMAG